MYEYLCTGESRRPWNPGAHGIQGVALDSKELEAEVGENHQTQMLGTKLRFVLLRAEPPFQPLFRSMA